MERIKMPIMLVSSVSPSFCGQLGEKLIHLDYGDVDNIGWDDLLHNTPDHFNKVFVVPFSNKDPACHNMQLVFERMRKLRVLGVIQDNEKNLDMDFLRCCNEILCWPCSKNELALRLNRLCVMGGVVPDLTSNKYLLEDFIDLNLVGNSPVFLYVLKQLKKIAGVDAPVLIEGETGTGKEMAARAIHYMSERRDFPFIPVNCGAIPDNLLENELFGHEKGAYTDAKWSQRGLINQAERGTIFFDEVETFSPKGQFVLLRFLDDKVFRPLGSEQSRQANVRILSASNTKLLDMVHRGKFRQDLLYRLDILSIELPPLSQREGDIELLAKHFLNKYRLQYNQPDKYLDPEMIRWMKSYSWPGNVRELENMINREFLLADGSSIQISKGDIPQTDRRKTMLDRRQNLFLDHSFNEAKKKIIDQFEKKYLTWLIRASNGNVTWAAKRAGKERRSLGKLLKKHKIPKTAA